MANKYLKRTGVALKSAFLNNLQNMGKYGVQGAALLGAMDVADRGRKSVVRGLKKGLKADLHGGPVLRSVGQGMFEGGVENKNATYKGVLKDVGVKNKTAQNVGGFLGDQVLDPINWAGGAVGKAALGAVRGMKPAASAVRKSSLPARVMSALADETGSVSLRKNRPFIPRLEEVTPYEDINEVVSNLAGADAEITRFLSKRDPEALTASNAYRGGGVPLDFFKRRVANDRRYRSYLDDVLKEANVPDEVPVFKGTVGLDPPWDEAANAALVPEHADMFARMRYAELEDAYPYDELPPGDPMLYESQVPRRNLFGIGVPAESEVLFTPPRDIRGSRAYLGNYDEGAWIDDTELTAKELLRRIRANNS